MNTKKILVLVGILFLGFWMLNDPNGMADSLKNGGSAVWGMLTQVFDAILSFVDAL